MQRDDVILVSIDDHSQLVPESTKKRIREIYEESGLTSQPA
jgi:hypothetical protein